MYSSKILLAAACLAVSGLASAAAAAPWDHGQDRDHGPGAHRATSHETHRAYAPRQRIYDALRFHHYRAFGEPVFLHGHYVLRGMRNSGRNVWIEVDPYTGAFIGEFHT